MTTTPDFRALLADDAYAASFQSLKQYRTALLKVLANTLPEPPTDEEIATAIQKGADQEFHATVEALAEYCGAGVELTDSDAREVLHGLRRPHIALCEPEPPTGQIIFNTPSTEEIIRLNKEGFHYKGQFIADAGEAHCLMLAFLKQHAKVEQEPPTDEELDELFIEIDQSGKSQTWRPFARAVIDRWGK